MISGALHYKIIETLYSYWDRTLKSEYSDIGLYKIYKEIKELWEFEYHNWLLWKRPFCRVGDVTKPNYICVIKIKDKPVVYNLH